MLWLLKRWWAWLGVLSLCLGLSSAFLLRSDLGRITWENFERIRPRMSITEVNQILGEPRRSLGAISLHGSWTETWVWSNGPTKIHVTFTNGRVRDKDGWGMTAWERLKWNVGKQLDSIGLSWKESGFDRAVEADLANRERGQYPGLTYFHAKSLPTPQELK